MRKTRGKERSAQALCVIQLLLCHQVINTLPSPWDPGSNAEYSAPKARAEHHQNGHEGEGDAELLPSFPQCPSRHLRPAMCSRQTTTRASLAICRAWGWAERRSGEGCWLLLDVGWTCCSLFCSARTSAQLQVVHATSSASQRMHQSHPPTRKAGVQPVSHRGRGMAAKSRRAGSQEERSGMRSWGMLQHGTVMQVSAGTLPLSRLHWMSLGSLARLGHLTGFCLASAWLGCPSCPRNKPGWIRMDRPGSSDLLSITPPFHRFRSPSTPACRNGLGNAGSVNVNSQR